jgi:hypothetical protein
VHSVFTKGRYFALGFVCGAICCNVGTLGQNKVLTVRMTSCSTEEGVHCESVSYPLVPRTPREGCGRPSDFHRPDLREN